MILVAGFNGTVGIILGVDTPTMFARLNDGKRCVDILHRYLKNVGWEMNFVGNANGKHSSTGATTAESFEHILF